MCAGQHYTKGVEVFSSVGFAAWSLGLTDCTGKMGASET